MADFKLVGPQEKLRTVIAPIESATVIEAGDMVDKDGSGYIAKADASSDKIAFSPLAKANGDTQIEMSVGNDFWLEGTGDAVFAISQRGTEVDIVMSSTTQLIDVGTSSTDVFVIGVTTDAGTVGSTAAIRVRINDGYQIV